MGGEKTGVGILKLPYRDTRSELETVTEYLQIYSSRQGVLWKSRLISEISEKSLDAVQIGIIKTRQSS